MRLLLCFVYLLPLAAPQNEYWRNQYPDSATEDAAENANTLNTIRFWHRRKNTVLVVDKEQFKSCKSILGNPPTATYHVHDPRFNPSLTHIKRTYPIERKTVFEADLIRAASDCTGNPDISVITMEVGYSKMIANKAIYEERCNICYGEDMGPRNCSNGEYASEYLKIGKDNFVSNEVKCLPCPPGTWMTCAEKSSCAWPIPQSLSDYNPGRDFWMPKSPSGNYYVPVGTCLPCETAGASKSHYGDDPSRASFIQATPSYEFTSTPPNARTIGLPWSCPGGDQAPRMCTIPDTHGDPLTSAQCLCKAGFALTVSNTCVTCPRGSQCRRGFAEPCPDHSHQPNTGQTDCVNCTSDGTERGEPVTYCGLGGQLRKCISVYKAAQLQCVNCNQCRKMYLPNNAGGKVDCYN